MNTDTYTTEGSSLEAAILPLLNYGTVTIVEAIAIFKAVSAIANDRPIDGTRWIEECQALCTKR